MHQNDLTMHFFADPQLADITQGVRRVLGQPRKHPELVLQGDKPWENRGVDGRNAIWYDPERGCYRIWYTASASMRVDLGDQSALDSSERYKGDRVNHCCYAESRDGIHWEKPELGLYEFQGSKANNIIGLGSSDSPLATIMCDPADPDPARRFKAIGYGGGAHTHLANPPQGGAAVNFSADGFTWSTPLTVMDGRNDLTDMTTAMPMREPTTGRWVAFFRPRTRPKRRYIGYGESTDFLHWTFPRMLLCPDRQDTPWTEFYGLTAAVIGGRRVGLLWIFHNHPEHSPMTNELVYSRHGLDYERVMPRQEFVPLGANGTHDSRRVWPACLQEVGDELFIYYRAGNREHGSDRIDAVTPGEMQDDKRVDPGCEPRSGIGLARLPWGHFCGWCADSEGTVETRWMDNYGSGPVRIAAEIRQGGYIRAEILGVYGTVLEGWNMEASSLQPGPRGTWIVNWGEGLDGTYGQTSKQGAMVGHVVKLRFHLYRATLFGVGIGEENAMPAFQ